MPISFDSSRSNFHVVDAALDLDRQILSLRSNSFEESPQVAIIFNLGFVLHNRILYVRCLAPGKHTIDV